MQTDKIIVLDLDSTIISTSTDMQLYYQLYDNPLVKDRLYTFELVDASNEIPGTGNICTMWGITRPYLNKFLQFIDKYFAEVRVWSAGQYKYVHAIVNVLYARLPELRRPTIIKTYDNCIFQKSNIYKHLNTFSPHEQSKLIALDDRADTFSQNPENGIQISVYEPVMLIQDILRGEVSLLQLMCWLLIPKIRHTVDIRTLNKNHIFKITLPTYLKCLQSGHFQDINYLI